MTEWRYYKKHSLTKMRPYEPSKDDLTGVSVLKGYSPKKGDMIAQNDTDPEDLWLVSKEYFDHFYDPNPIEKGEE